MCQVVKHFNCVPGYIQRNVLYLTAITGRLIILYFKIAETLKFEVPKSLKIKLVCQVYFNTSFHLVHTTQASSFSLS